MTFITENYYQLEKTFEADDGNRAMEEGSHVTKVSLWQKQSFPAFYPAKKATVWCIFRIWFVPEKKFLHLKEQIKRRHYPMQIEESQQSMQLFFSCLGVFQGSFPADSDEKFFDVF